MADNLTNRPRWSIAPYFIRAVAWKTAAAGSGEEFILSLPCRCV